MYETVPQIIAMIISPAVGIGNRTPNRINADKAATAPCARNLAANV